MKKDFSKLVIVALLSLCLGAAYSFKLKTKSEHLPQPKRQIEEIEKILENTEAAKPTEPQTAEISVKMPAFLTYPQTVAQLKKWQAEAPDLTEVDVYGKTKKGVDLFYIKIGNKLNKNNKPNVLITASIHGNEPWSSGVTMAYIGNMLDQYGKDKTITDLVDSRNIYFVPVVSPDSYPQSRHVDGVDPNRDFPTPEKPDHQSTPTVDALRNLFWDIKPAAVLSGHTFGRLYLTPYGDKYGKTPHETEFSRIVGKMAEMSKYKKIHCSELYSKPFDGSEVDWFYRNGAMAIVAEYGTHQRKPSLDEIKSEFLRTKDSISLWIKEAPEVKIITQDEDVDFSKNTGIARKYHRLANGHLTPADPY